MVTLCCATSNEIAFMAAVRPARGPADSVMCGRGVVTMADVMLMMRPNLRSIMPGSTRCVSSSGAIMLLASAFGHSSGFTLRKPFGSGPLALLIRMSGCGHAASSAS
jgi:hypothetical protein